MTAMTYSSAGPGYRFYEVQNLLRAYGQTGNSFTDTPDTPGPALRGFLRVVTRFPARGARLLRELDDLLTVGLFSPEIADEVELMPRVRPTEGRSVEESLSLVRDHVRAALRNPERWAGSGPEKRWEWGEFFPEVFQLLGAYFHQDFSYEYASHREAVEDYLAGSTREELERTFTELSEVLAVAGSDEELDLAARALGMEVSPPKGETLRQWLNGVASLIHRHAQG
ncbi:hypothetical protein H8N01_28585 [Streptomyces sp. AC536]|uniref:contact-dependent growth inhibition system immunity protein n=1 Tax=Streptomyces buecherae TaxID=2763006 RepID=UPI00164D485B|nr:contact-dependent growth inhibition system immunity protein [Streptomyces buecherae]MBC3986429.1 hypothetical protein [Streptomyces buecherae]QNJ39287.1 hypothetical protein H7H31_04755 [Streptomyces buecherae]